MTPVPAARFAPGAGVSSWSRRVCSPDDYRTALDRHVESGGWAVVATFGPDGPTHCSGLPIVRYNHDDLAAEFPGFTLVDTAGDDHETPWGTIQQFSAVLLRRN